MADGATKPVSEDLPEIPPSLDRRTTNAPPANEEDRFAPLTPDEREIAQRTQESAKPVKKPIVPVPDDAPPMQFRHPKHGEPSKSYAYEDADGKLVGYMCRWDFEDVAGEPDKLILPITYCDLGNGRKGWRASGFPTLRPLYKLGEILAKPLVDVLVVEGEKAADAAATMFPDMAVTTPPHGANSPGKADWALLEGRTVVICPDNDETGLQFANDVAGHVHEAGATIVRVVQVPDDFRPKWDLADPMPDGWTTQRWQELMDTAPIAEVDVDPDDSDTPILDDTEQMRGRVGHTSQSKSPRLLIQHTSPNLTVAALRDILSETSDLYDRGVPVRLAIDQTEGGVIAQMMTPDALVMMAHEVCRPYLLKEKDGVVVEVDARLSRQYAVMYLGWRGEWHLPLLNGIASAPLLDDDGTIHSADGYDPSTGMWGVEVPDLAGLIPAKPTMDDAAKALRLIREAFKTFCFADADTVSDAASGLDLVDTSRPPGKDESGFLAALLTAVCRPSLHLAPGVLLRAAPMSGAGTGKGLLARCISIVAFGREPHAVTGGANAEELEKRIASELIEGSPVLFLDNLNNTSFRSNLLASAITERPARVRILGRSQMVPLNASALVILTGNGLSISEDLARRFIAVDFDSGTEEPEERAFPNDIRTEVRERRTELLAALLTIWRWGRTAEGIASGRMLGSFEQWSTWVRDPLLTLGCCDPVDRVGEAKERDNRRQAIVELFEVWWEQHYGAPIAVWDLNDEVKRVADPQGRGRQYLSAKLEKLVGTRMVGLVLTRQSAAGKWGAATYALETTAGQEPHRGHRAHREKEPENRSMPGAGPPLPRSESPYAPDADGTGIIADDPTPPMPPMPSARPQKSTQVDANSARWKGRV